MTACDFQCTDANGLHDCQCSRCGRFVRVRRLPVNAECVGAYIRRDEIASHSVGTARTEFRPGTALKSLLATIGITAAPNCSCQRHANEMDARGCDWCEQNLDTIVGWLREEATKRSLPFLDAAGRILVRRAISNARRAAAN
jgi:hypothetical protein